MREPYLGDNKDKSFDDHLAVQVRLYTEKDHIQKYKYVCGEFTVISTGELILGSANKLGEAYKEGV